MGFLLGRCCGTKEYEEGKKGTRLYLNVYDLTPVNHYLYWFGLGIFHSGIQVHGTEYAFGAHKYSSSGVFEVEPKSCHGFIFKKSILLGTTEMSRSEVRSLVENLASSYHGDTYNLINKNCNHFTDDVCTRLSGKSIPGWVNRLARLEEGSESVTSTALADSEEAADGLEETLINARSTPYYRRRRKTC
ncbi:hypothetical protein KSS87_004557 [Heliosperma pusillum]|nr:hypothetical protein KSS87_004557 [Heliosperma pusillum]